MNPPNPTEEPDPMDTELKRQIARTSTRLEFRFQHLRRQLEHRQDMEREPRCGPWLWLSRLALGGGAIAASLAVAWLWLGNPVAVVERPGEELFGPAFFAEDPFAWDASLAQALPLLNEEALETLFILTYENDS